MKLKRNITLDYILSKVSAYDIYAYYMPWPFKLNKNCLSPFKSENYPSFIIGNKLGKITHKAFNGNSSSISLNKSASLMISNWNLPTMVRKPAKH